MATETHVHDCTGPGMKCPCGFVFTVPPVFVSIQVFDKRDELVDKAFNCDDVYGAIYALESAANKLRRLKT